MKSKLLKYASKSSLMDIDIFINGERIRFNLFRELKITEEKVSLELKNQPSYYGFITMCHKTLLKELMDLQVEEKKIYSLAYITNKNKINPETQRVNSDDVAKSKAEKDINYLKIQRLVISKKYDVNRLENCVRAFEQRAGMMQTLSANIRNEKW